MDESMLYDLYDDLKSQRNVILSSIDLSMDLLDATFVGTATKNYHATTLKLKFQQLAAVDQAFAEVALKLFK